MNRQPFLHRLVAGCTVLLVAAASVPAQEKNDAQSRRTVATTEWPSLKGVLAIGEVRALLKLSDEEREEVELFVRGRQPRQRDDNWPVLPPLPPDAAPWQVELQRQERRLRGILGDERYARIRQLGAGGRFAGGLHARRSEPAARRDE